MAGISLEENRPKPDRQIGSIEIGAIRAAILHLYWPTSHGITDEVPDSEMGVQGEMRPDEGKTPSNGCLQTMFSMRYGTEKFPNTLSLSIGRIGIHGIGSPRICLRDVSHVRGLLSIDCSGTHKKEPLRTNCHSKVKSATSSPDNRVEHLVRLNRSAGGSAGMNHMGEGPFRKPKIPYITPVECNR
jgi:hypothetical protein